MSKCKHNYVSYLGEQETLTKGKKLKLYQCISCHSTIFIKKNNNSIIIDNPED